jgi:hypothetical protein
MKNEKTIFRLVRVLCLCWFVSVVGLRQYYIRSRPESPQKELGLTVGIDANYGKTVFVSPKEKRLSDLLDESVALPLAIGATYFLVLVRRAASEK